MKNENLNSRINNGDFDGIITIGISSFEESTTNSSLVSDVPVSERCAGKEAIDGEASLPLYKRPWRTDLPIGTFARYLLAAESDLRYALRMEGKTEKEIEKAVQTSPYLITLLGKYTENKRSVS